MLVVLKQRTSEKESAKIRQGGRSVPLLLLCCQVVAPRVPETSLCGGLEATLLP